MKNEVMFVRKVFSLMQQVVFDYLLCQDTVCVCVCAQSLQLCPTLCDPMDCRPPGSFVHGIFQATVLEWFAISFSRESSRPRDRTQVSCIVDRRFTRRKWRLCKIKAIIVHGIIHSTYSFNEY